MRNLILIVALVCLTSCVVEVKPVTNQDDDKITVVLDGSMYDVYRFIDREANVVCYLSRRNTNGSGGISCLPLTETTLD